VAGVHRYGLSTLSTAVSLACPIMTQHLKDLVLTEARAAGFDVARVTTPAALDPRTSQRLAEFLENGRHGDMEWMASTAERRRHPNSMWPQTRSIIMLGMNYAPKADPLSILAEPGRGAISCYAQCKDYHDVVRTGLKRVAGSLAAASGAAVKIFVDTAPLMEKPLGEAAGLGWQGKHTNLVSRDFGSWLFLGAILTEADLEPDTPEADHCGTCRRCIDICPTKAFPAPYQLDARRCIAYLTIEHKGHIPAEFREPIGNRVFGCDDCLAVCPWNKFAEEAHLTKLQALPSSDSPPLAELLELDDAAFRSRFAGTPVKRTGRDRVVRNALIAAGNSGDRSLLPIVERLLDDPSPLVRAMAVWALRRLADGQARLEATRRMEGEMDANVRAEWAAV
jgi:epoxyqueuosine reductase